MATITITVTVAGGKFVLDGVSQATYSATPGNTYKFDQADGTNGTHPLRLSTTSDGTHNSGSAYTDGVTTNGTPGSAGAYTQIVVDATTVQSLFYYCSNHSGMGGAFNVGSSATVQYQDRAGFAVQNRTTDPVPFAQAKINDPYVGSWASGGSLNDGRSSFTGIGIQTATVAVSGQDSTTSLIDSVEEYNGTAWTEVNDTPVTLKYPGAGGVLTAGWVAGGLSTYNGTAFSAETFEYDGTNWTDSGNINTTRYVCYGGGPQTAAFIAGGNNTSFAAVDDTELYNGSAWTEVADLNTARANAYGNGTQTAGIYAGGSPGTKTDAETWDGSSWTEVSELNTGRYSIGVGGGTSPGSSSLAVGGTDGSNNKANVESWNGSAWTETSDLAATNSSNGLGISSNQSAISFGGFSPSPSTFATTSEEWTFTGIAPDAPAVGYAESIVGDLYYNSGTGTFKVIKDGGAPIGTWASGGNLNQRRGSTKGFGTTTAAITAGGVYSPISPPSAQAGQVENYNGTSWTEVAELNVARQAHQSAGTATAGMVALGYKNGGNAPETELWNGSAWTETADANTARTSVRGCGTTTAALAIGGYNPPPALQLDITESWNGSAWSEVNDMNTRRSGAGVAVSSPYSDTIIFGGYSQPPPNTANAETWNGSAWTETGNLNTAKDNMGGAGASSTSALCFGGRGPIVNTESWDGTSWTEVNNLAKGRGYMASAGTAGAALASGGESPGSPPTNYYDNETEEWTFADFEIKTVTTS